MLSVRIHFLLIEHCKRKWYKIVITLWQFDESIYFNTDVRLCLETGNFCANKPRKALYQAVSWNSCGAFATNPDFNSLQSFFFSSGSVEFDLKLYDGHSSSAPLAWVSHLDFCRSSNGSIRLCLPKGSGMVHDIFTCWLSWVRYVRTIQFFSFL